MATFILTATVERQRPQARVLEGLKVKLLMIGGGQFVAAAAVLKGTILPKELQAKRDGSLTIAARELFQSACLIRVHC